MARTKAIVLIWIAGYFIGFLAYLVLPALSQLVNSLLPLLIRFDERVAGAMIMGMISSIVTVVAVVIWAYSSSSGAYSFPDAT